MRIMSVCACGLHSLNFLRLIYHEWLQRKIILKTSAGGAECVLVPHLGGDGITCTSWSDANLGIPPGAMIKQYMGVAPLLSLWCIYPTISTIQTYFRVSVVTSDSFFVWQKKSSTDPASPSSSGVARSNIDVASRTIHTLAAFHWHTHRQGRLLFGQQAFQGCDEDLLFHDLPDFLKAVIRKKTVDFDFVNVRVINEPWEIILV